MRVSVASQAPHGAREVHLELRFEVGAALHRRLLDWRTISHRRHEKLIQQPPCLVIKGVVDDPHDGEVHLPKFLLALFWPFEHFAVVRVATKLP